MRTVRTVTYNGDDVAPLAMPVEGRYFNPPVNQNALDQMISAALSLRPSAGEGAEAVFPPGIVRVPVFPDSVFPDYTDDIFATVSLNVTGLATCRSDGDVDAFVPLTLERHAVAVRQMTSALLIGASQTPAPAPLPCSEIDEENVLNMARSILFERYMRITTRQAENAYIIAPEEAENLSAGTEDALREAGIKFRSLLGLLSTIETVWKLTEPYLNQTTGVEQREPPEPSSYTDDVPF